MKHPTPVNPRKAFAWLLALLILMAGFLLAIVVLSIHAQAQTRVKWSQLQKPPYEGLQESEWCQGPTLYWTGPKELTIGRNWTPEAPCYVHFNIVPQAAPDPLNVSTVSMGATVTLDPANDYDEDIYVWMTPGQGGTAVIVVGVTRPGAIVQCQNCVKQANQPLPRVFPSGTTPVGLARVIGGQLQKALHSILQTHQIYLMPGTDMSISFQDGGIAFQVSAAPPAQVQQLVSALDTARNRAVAAQVQMQAAQPVGEAKLAALETRLNDKADELSRYYMDLYGRVVPKGTDIASAARNLSNLVDQARMMTVRGPDMMYQANYEAARQAAAMATSEAARMIAMANMLVPAPKKQTDPCATGNYARDAKYFYTCVAPPGLQTNHFSPVPGQWVRVRLTAAW